MCPLLRRWRKAKAKEKEGKDNVKSSNAIVKDFFESLDVACNHGRKVGFATR